MWPVASAPPRNRGRRAPGREASTLPRLPFEVETQYRKRERERSPVSLLPRPNANPRLVPSLSCTSPDSRIAESNNTKKKIDSDHSKCLITLPIIDETEEEALNLDWVNEDVETYRIDFGTRPAAHSPNCAR